MSSTQLDCSIGISAAEGTYGTEATVSKFFEFVDESFDWDPTFVQGAGLRVSSRVARAARRELGRQMASGDLTVEASSKGLGALLKAAFGGLTNTEVADDAGVYQQVHTPAVSDYLESYTIQKGIPLLGGGSAQAMTFPGAQCSSIEFDCPNSDIVAVKTSWIAREVKTATAYATPSYATDVELFTFTKGEIAIGGSITGPTTTAIATGGTAVADIRDFNLTWDNHLDDGGFNLGGAGKRSRKAAVGLSELKGKVTAEFDAVTLRDAYLNQTELGLLLTLTGLIKLADDTSYPVLQIWVPCLDLEGELPKAAGGDVVTQSIDFTGLDDLTHDPITVVYVTEDTAP